jgi:hypothetical protein
LLLTPLQPPPAKTGRRRSSELRELINTIFVLRGAGALAAAPDNIRWFMRVRDDANTKRLNQRRVLLDRQRVGR